MIDTPYEFMYVTVHYDCGCITARPVQRHKGVHHTISSPFRCKVCSQLEERAQERRATLKQEHQARRIRYMVDGYAMHIFRDKQGYWQGRCQKNKQTIQKYFGRSDPRPGLEEALE
jgi:hypothetical protein